MNPCAGAHRATTTRTTSDNESAGVRRHARWAPCLAATVAILVATPGMALAGGSDPASPERPERVELRNRLDPAAARGLGITIRDPGETVAASAVRDRYWVDLRGASSRLSKDTRVVATWDNEIFTGLVMLLTPEEARKLRTRSDVVSAEPVAMHRLVDDGATPLAEPDPPEQPTVTAGDEAVVVEWELTSGDPPSGWDVEVSVAGSGKWFAAEGCEDVAADESGCTATGLDNGMSYVFRVRGKNADGPGAWSAESDPVTPAPDPSPSPTPSPPTPAPTPTPTPTPTPEPEEGPTTNGYAWGRDRLDQPTLPLDHSYEPEGDGSVVHIYISDSGIDGHHGDFEGRLGIGYSPYVDDNPYVDCEGHGTHVAGTAAGAPKVGVATGATLHSVVAGNCDGEVPEDDRLMGWLWVLEQGKRPAVINYSAGRAGTSSSVTIAAIQLLYEKGIPVVVAAGNEPTDACLNSPADVPAAVTVGATNARDEAAEWTAYGPCIDVMAPGEKILSSDYEESRRGIVHSGTSMAAPHVTGAIAVHWSLHPKLDGEEVVAAVLANSRAGALTFPDGQGGTPNLLLQVDAATPQPDPTPTPDPEPTYVPAVDPVDPNGEVPANTGAEPLPAFLAALVLIGLGIALLRMSASTRTSRGRLR